MKLASLGKNKMKPKCRNRFEIIRKKFNALKFLFSVLLQTENHKLKAEVRNKVNIADIEALKHQKSPQLNGKYIHKRDPFENNCVLNDKLIGVFLLQVPCFPT